MNGLHLRKLTFSDKVAVEDYLIELIKNGNTIKGFLYEDGDSFEKTYEKLKKKEELSFTDYYQKDFPCVQYLLVREKDERVVGLVNVRPFLTKELDEGFEGNIGYSIRPTERGKGYGDIALKLALLEFKKLNLKDDIVICCYRENIGSKKIIQNNGGALLQEEDGILVAQKYLIKR